MRPKELGLPFEKWRQYQLETIVQVASDSKKVIFVEAPTGAGKSGIAVGAAHASGVKSSVVVCSTLQLQDQYVGLGLPTVRGRGNFPCLIDPVTADQARCTIAGPKDCEEAFRCPYYVQLGDGMSAPMSVHNYSYWLTASNLAHRFTDQDLVVLDEAHTLDRQLRRMAEVEINFRSFGKMGVSIPDYGVGRHRDWSTWAKTIAREFAEYGSTRPFNDLTHEDVAHIRAGRAILDKTKALSVLDDDWIIQKSMYGYTFQPVWADQFAQPLIFRHGRKFLLMSATILDAGYMCRSLGLSPDAVSFYRMPSTFPKESRPIIFRPVAKVGMRMSGEEQQDLIDAVDRILDDHSLEKGLIHTSNYELAGLLASRCKGRGRMMTHSTKDRMDVVEEFKRSSRPLVLLSPSFTTGLDLPHDYCRFSVTAKLPFPNMGDELVKRRMKAGPDGQPNPKGQSWYEWETTCDLVQSAGRGMRSEDDRCTHYIIDSNFAWFRHRVKSLLPSWFKEALKEERADVDFFVEQLRR